MEALADDDGTSPVRPSESVYRRIHMNYYKSGDDIPVKSAAFRPTKDDDTGVSVVRVIFTCSPNDALVNVKPDNINKYYVAEIQVSALVQLALSVTPDPIPGCKGHALIAEFKLSEYEDANKTQGLKDKMTELAAHASKNIVRTPTIA